jgi:N-acetylmuramoyl-L-alanine amidase
MRQKASHVRPQRSAPPATSGAPRLLAWVIFLTAAYAIGRGLLGLDPVPGEVLPRPPAAATDTAAPVVSGSTEAPPPLPDASPTPSGPLPVGIVAGHWGYDSGAVCDDGLQEVEINLEIARRVVSLLTSQGYETDLLEEFDSRLHGYRAQALVSIHADSCTYPHSGFKVARVVDSAVPAVEDRLVQCLIDEYGAVTGLAFHADTVTEHMTQYHTFYEIDPLTPGAIIETGFMLADRQLLIGRPDLVAWGIAEGLLCFLEGQAP